MRMAVPSHAKEHEIKSRKAVRRREKECSQALFVVCGGTLGVGELGRNAKDVIGGDGELSEQRLIGQR